MTMRKNTQQQDWRKKLARREVLLEMHRLLAADLLAQLKDPDKRPNAAMMDVARKFLVDNGMNAESIKSHAEVADGLDELLADLPFDHEGDGAEDNVITFDLSQ
jgi:hypothetical protein